MKTTSGRKPITTGKGKGDKRSYDSVSRLTSTKGGTPLKGNGVERKFAKSGDVS